MTLEEVRRHIDEIDKQLLPLFVERMECARQVAQIKTEQHLPVLRPEREAQILDRMEREGGVYGSEARVLYTVLMGMSRALQHRLMGGGKEVRELAESAPSRVPSPARIACSGVAGAYAHEAAEQLYPDAAPIFCTSFAEVFQTVERGDAELGLVPVENSSAGSVSEVYDLLLRYRFFIAAAASVQVRHCLAIPRGADLSLVRDVYSHPQALAQCSEYLAAHSLRPVPFSNTAAAAKMAAETGGSIAVVCSPRAAEEYGLDIAAREIQNSDNNRTRFLAIGKTMFLPPDADKISLCFSLPHTTGSLSAVLTRFAMSGLNLTKIESRPIADKNFEYDFYLDFTGNIHDGKTLDLIAALHDELPRFSFLGNYRESEGGLALLPVKSDERIRRVCLLADRIWHEHYDPLIGKEQVDYMVKNYQSLPAVTDQLKKQNYRYYLFLLDGQDAGYLGLQPGNPDGDSLFLSKLYVDSAFRRRGVAAGAFAFAKRFAVQNNMKRIWLTVNKHNSGSIAAYEKLGLRRARDLVTDIGGGFVMDDYLMEYIL